MLARTGMRLALDPYRAVLSLITILTVTRIHQHFPMIARLRPGATIELHLKPSIRAPISE